MAAPTFGQRQNAPQFAVMTAKNTVKVIPFKFAPNGAVSPLPANTLHPDEVSVNRNNPGTFVLTLPKNATYTYTALLGAAFHLQQTAVGPGYCFQITQEDVANTGTVTVEFLQNTAGAFAAADIAAAAGTFITGVLIVDGDGYSPDSYAM